MGELRYPSIKVRVTEQVSLENFRLSLSHNVYSTISTITSALKEGGVPPREIDLFLSQVVSGEYSTLNELASEWVTLVKNAD